MCNIDDSCYEPPSTINEQYLCQLVEGKP